MYRRWLRTRIDASERDEHQTDEQTPENEGGTRRGSHACRLGWRVGLGSVFGVADVTQGVYNYTPTTVLRQAESAASASQKPTSRDH